ncbi:TPA: S-layer protein [Candidatus Woesearchaeota archaeon]|nr:S-layer protein [Candidatus Woesearchaeota archaeon]
MFIAEKSQDNLLTLPAKELRIKDFRSASSPLAEKILHQLSIKESYPKELARTLKVNEQKIYYHIRNLQKNGIIKQVKSEAMQGGVANYYTLTEPAFIVKFSELKETQKIASLKPEYVNFLEPFIVDGRLDAQIIVGSPEPHGIEKARSKDALYAIELALLLGTFLNHIPINTIKLDTETHAEHLKNNLIIIGGPVVNKITEKINDYLPVKFNKTHAWNIESSLTNEIYAADEIGIIVKIKNPFAKDKSILLIAGKRHAGTKAAIIALSKNLKEIAAGNLRDSKILAKVVEGIDKDADGIIDEVEIKE